MTPLPVVLAVGVERDRLAPLGELGLQIETVEDATVPFDGVPVLVVTRARVSEARALWASVPLLALVDDPHDALDSVRDGADHVLLEHASPSLLCAVGLAAMRADIAALRNSELRYRTMMTSCVDAILVADMETARFVDANAAASAMFGYTGEELRGMTGRMLAGPAGAEHVDRISRSLRATGKASSPLHPMSRKDGSVLWADVSLTAFEYMGRSQFMVIIRDVTEQVARERELERAHRELEESHRRALHTGRLAALGQLAASVAHEINNPLQVVLARLEDLSLGADDDSALRPAFDEMRDGLERVRQTTRSLLPFARIDTAAPEDVDLREVVEWAARVTANSIRHRAQLEVRHGAVRKLRGNSSGLGQLVTNLLTNAGHAIEEGRLGDNRIVVTTQETAAGVQLIVEDTGCGMSKEVRERVFEPFFTTKSRDVGTGLGLSLCAEIAARHEATIDIESTVGVGTRVTVTFRTPVIAAPAPPASDRVPVVSTLRILVVDDEKLVLDSYRRQLRELAVVTAHGGQAALDLLETDQAFDAVICDVMMPDVDGLEVYERIGRLAPDLQKCVIFCSGGAFTARARETLGTVPNLVLDKPVSRGELRAAIARVVGR